MSNSTALSGALAMHSAFPSRRSVRGVSAAMYPGPRNATFKFEPPGASSRRRTTFRLKFAADLGAQRRPLYLPPTWPAGTGSLMVSAPARVAILPWRACREPAFCTCRARPGSAHERSGQPLPRRALKPRGGGEPGKRGAPGRTGRREIRRAGALLWLGGNRSPVTRLVKQADRSASNFRGGVGLPDHRPAIRDSESGSGSSIEPFRLRRVECPTS